MSSLENKSAHYLLDITGDRCPMTFVKTRLMLDKMRVGETLCVQLKGEEPLKNVPRSAKELGHLVAEPILEEGGLASITIEKV
jgi:TusA-related sulfurtransferase